MKRAFQAILLAFILFGWMLVAAALPADAVQDVREWPSNGLPVVSNWNTLGYDANWHVDQARAGNRFIPSFKFNPLDRESPLSRGPTLTPVNEAFMRVNRIPIGLRSDNWATNITQLKRLPIALESIPNSPVVWTIKGGVLGDEGIADCFGPAPVWRDAGTKWATQSGLIADLQKRFPDAAYLLLGDNNEANVDFVGRYADTTTNDKTGITTSTWKPALETLSLRVRDFAVNHTPAEFAAEFAARRDTQYNELSAGFSDGLGPWKGRVYTEAYKVGTVQAFYGDQFGHYDGGGSPLYVSGNSNGITADFTNPDWFKIFYISPISLKFEAENPKHFREWFIQFYPGTAFEGYKAGRHAIMTPERIEAWVQWLCWVSRGNHRGLNLRCFTETREKPTNSFLDSDASRKIVTDAGNPELIALTEEDYFRPVMTTANKIAENPILRRFFVDGNAVQTGTNPLNEVRAFTSYKPIVFPQPGQPDDGFRLLDCDLNTPRSNWIWLPGPNARGKINPNISIKVWGTATELKGDYLVHLWTPCVLTGQCTITIPGAGVPLPVAGAGMLPQPASFTVDVPQPNSYVVIHKGKVLTLDEYATAIAKTPFDLWLESRPDLAGEPVDVLRVIFKVNNPPIGMK